MTMGGRRKSMSPIDRMPKFRNEPSNAPLHQMVRPHSALNKTIGDRARQFSSFTPDGFFPEAFGVHRAVKGQTDMDRQLLKAQRKSNREIMALERSREHNLLTQELDRVLRQPLVDFLVRTPTPALDGGGSLEFACEDFTSSTALLLQTTSSSSTPAHGQHSRPQQQHFHFQQEEAIERHCTSPVPPTTPGSRPTTPSVYVGGKVQPELHYYSRPSSAATTITTVNPVASSLVGGFPTTTKPRPLVPNHHATGDRPVSATRSNSQTQSGCLQTFVREGGELPDWVLQRLADRDQRERKRQLASMRSSSSAALGQRLASRPPSATLERAISSMFDRPPAADRSVSPAADVTHSTRPDTPPSPHRKQRHQTQLRKQEGFNISTSSIMHDAEDTEFKINELLRSRPSSAASLRDPSGGVDSELNPAASAVAAAGRIRPNAVGRPSSAQDTGAHRVLVYPLRSVFLS